MFEFGKASTERLESCDKRLQAVCGTALGYGVMDFSIIDGHRSVQEQQRLFREGKSQLDGVNRKSKHNHKPSLAVDVLPYPHKVNGVNVWNDKQRFAVLAGLLMAAASEHGVELRWGGDWDGDGNNADSNFHDMPHFELRL